MSKRTKTTSTLIFGKIKEGIINSDIRTLVVIPPFVGFGSFFILLFVFEELTNGATPKSFFEIGLGMACLIECVAGISMVIKKEMPGPFGKIVTGKQAVASGVVIILLFGLGGLMMIGYGIGHI